MNHNSVKRKLPPLPRGYEWRVEKRPLHETNWPYRLTIVRRLWFITFSTGIQDIVNFDVPASCHDDARWMRHRLYEKLRAE